MTTLVPRRKTKPSKYAWGKLTEKQKAFCEELAADPGFRVTEAAKQAGYGTPQQAAAKNLANKTVVAYLGYVLQKRLERRELKADDILDHLTQALFLDPLELFERVDEKTYRVKDLEEIPLQVRRCITKLKFKTSTRYDSEGNPIEESYVEVELMSKDAMMRLAMQHGGLLVEKVEVGLQGDLAAIIEGIEKGLGGNVIDVPVQQAD